MDIPDYSGELWNVLSYSGIWGFEGCRPEDRNTKLPKESVAYLTGIPYSGDNTGKNPNLRLLQFSSGNLNGPVQSLGPQNVQIIFFESSLINRVRWKVLERDLPDDFAIGFYTPNYVSLSNGPLEKRSLLLLTEDGPAFYTKAQGEFETTGFVSMYVVTVGNVSVRLKITARRQKCEEETICTDKLFDIYKYRVDGRTVATQQLIGENPPTILIRPTNRYAIARREMINYLIDTSVVINVFDRPSSLGLLSEEPIVYPNQHFNTPFNTSGYGHINQNLVDYSYKLYPGPYAPLAAQNGSSFIIPGGTEIGLRAVYTLKIVSMRPGNYTSSFFTQFVASSNGNALDCFGPLVPIPGAQDLVPRDDYSFQYSVGPIEVNASNINIQVMERRSGDVGNIFSDAAKNNTKMDSIDFTVVNL